jgi:hypothetical protein
MCMNNWGKYRLLILGIIILSFFVSRTFFDKDPAPKITPLPNTFNRNIDHLTITKHARCRMDCRNVTLEEVKEILHDGNINYMKSDLKDERGPTYALEGYSHVKQHLRIVFAPKQTELVVVTCIDLDKEWQCDCN